MSDIEFPRRAISEAHRAKLRENMATARAARTEQAALRRKEEARVLLADELAPLHAVAASAQRFLTDLAFRTDGAPFTCPYVRDLADKVSKAERT